MRGALGKELKIIPEKENQDEGRIWGKNSQVGSDQD